MIAVIAHDAGGAEILSSYIRRQKLDCFYVLEGPARKVFERKLGSIESSDLGEAIRCSTSVICGTGWQSCLEFNAIKLARTFGKYSVAFLDHWVNYRERFIRYNETCLPDEIWVGDTMAFIMAKELFPSIKIGLVENPYFQDVRKELAEISQSHTRVVSNSLSVLYVSEPIREHARLRFGDELHWGYLEDDALRYFLLNIEILGKPVHHISIRPHPSEPIHKYEWVKHEFNLPIVQGGFLTLLEEIAACDIVVGCESMALVVGLLAEKRVISCIPPGGKPCALPHSEIEHLQDILRGE